MRVITASFAIVSVLVCGVKSSTGPDEPPICGPDLDSSLEVGCVLDVAGLHWKPPACFNQGLSESSLKSLDLESGNRSTARKFDWFKDANKTQPLISLDDLRVYLEGRAENAEDIVAYTHASWHPTHCMYISKIATIAIEKVAAGEKNVYIPDMASQFDHANHCARVIDRTIQSAEWFSEPFEVRFGFTRCVQLS
ncbi:hypothetical protein LTR27_012238 [Elasticomyces elasticus]|nr:hypothetical protein LTR27_012238 [Elasticomyces elasticus]